MKVLIVLLGLFALQAHAYTRVTQEDLELFRELNINGITPFIMEDKVNNTLQNALQKLRDLGFDPLNLKSAVVNISNPLIDLHGNIDSVSVVNLLNITVNQIQLKLVPLSLTLGLSWEPITANLKNYDINGKILELIPLFGKGDLSGEISGLNLYFSASLTTKNGSIVIRTLDLDFNIAKLDVSATGLVGGDLGNLICQILNENAVTILGQIKDGYMDLIKKVVSQIVNKGLEGKSMQDIIDLITGNNKTTTQAPTTAPHRPL